MLLKFVPTGLNLATNVAMSPFAEFVWEAVKARRQGKNAH